MKSDEQVVRATDLYFDYGTGRGRVHGLVDVSLAVATGEMVAVMGPSGCGKTTLLHVIGGLDRPARGTVEVAGVAWGSVRGRASAITLGAVLAAVARLRPAAVLREA